MDIVIGQKNIPISLLVRNVMTLEGKLIGAKMGNPNIVLKEMGIDDDDRGKIICNDADIRFIDTHEKYIKNPEEQIKVQKRVTSSKATGFDDDRFGNFDWNFSIYDIY